LVQVSVGPSVQRLVSFSVSVVHHWTMQLIVIAPMHSFL